MLPLSLGCWQSWRWRSWCLVGDARLGEWHWGPWKGKEPSPLCWWPPHQSVQLEKPESVPTDEESFPFARRKFPGQRNEGFSHHVAEASGGMVGGQPSCHCATCAVSLTQPPRIVSPSGSSCPETRGPPWPLLRLQKVNSNINSAGLSWPLSLLFSFFNNSGLSLREEREIMSAEHLIFCPKNSREQIRIYSN